MVWVFADILGGSQKSTCLTFSADGQSLYRPEGNRVQRVGIGRNGTFTFGPELVYDVTLLAEHPNGKYVVAMDDHGHLLTLCTSTRRALSPEFLYRFPLPPSKLIFSICGSFIIACYDVDVELLAAPSSANDFKPQLLLRCEAQIGGVSSVAFSPCGRWLVTGGKDGFVRLTPIDAEVLSRVQVEAAATEVRYVASMGSNYFRASGRGITGTSLSHGGKILRVVDEGGTITSFLWESKEIFTEEGRKPEYRQSEGKWNLIYVKIVDEDTGKVDERGKIMINMNKDDTFRGRAVAFANGRPGRFAVAFEHGAVCVFEHRDPDALNKEGVFNCLHASTSGEPVVSLAFSNDDSYLGLNTNDELSVWDWRSGAFIYRHQGHVAAVTAVAFAPVDLAADGRGADVNRLDLKSNSRSMFGMASRSFVATADLSGAVKLWDADGCVCLKTWYDHTAAVKAICWAPQGNSFYTASQDGSVRGYEIRRLTCFRTFTDPSGEAQFNGVAVDPTGQIVLASAEGIKTVNPYVTFLWDIQTGKLHDRIPGHEDLITALAVGPSDMSEAATGSLDGTVRIWQMFGRSGKGGEPIVLRHNHGVTALSFDPRNNGQMAVASMGGKIDLWDFQDENQFGSIQGSRDVFEGRAFGSTRSSIRFSGKDKSGKSQEQKVSPLSFDKLTYTADGLRIIAAAVNCPRICIYSTLTRTLQHVVPITRNQSLSGVLRKLRQHVLETQGLAKTQLDMSRGRYDHNKELKDRRELPGSAGSQMEALQNRLTVQDISLSEDNRQLAVATTHGVFFFDREAGGAAIFSNRRRGLTSAALDLNSTPEKFRDHLARGNFVAAMRAALRMGELELLSECYVGIPIGEVPVVVQQLDMAEALAVVALVRLMLSENASNMFPTIEGRAVVSFLQLHLTWLKSVMVLNFSTMMLDTNSSKLLEDPRLKALRTEGLDLRSLCIATLRILNSKHAVLTRLFAKNAATLDFIARRKELEGTRDLN